MKKIVLIIITAALLLPFSDCLAGIDSPEEKLDRAIANARSYIGRNYDSTLYFIKRAESIAQNADNPEFNVETSIVRGIYHAEIGEMKRSEKCFLRAEQIVNENELESQRLHVYSNISNFYRYDGRYFKSIEYARKILDSEQSDKNDSSLAFHRICIFHQNFGDYGKAIDYANKMLRISRRTGDTTRIALSMTELADIYTNNAQFEKAKDIQLKIIEIHRKTGNKQGLANQLNSLGLIELNLGNNKKAREYFLRSFDIYEEIGKADNDNIGLYNVALTYFFENNYGMAEKYIKKSLDISKNLDEKDMIADNKMRLGEIALRRGNYQKSRELLAEALDIFKELPKYQRVARVYDNLSDIAFVSGNSEIAGRYDERAKDYIDSFYVNQQRNSIEMAEQKAKVEKNKLALEKDLQIAELRQDKMHQTIIYLALIVLGLIVAITITYSQYKRIRNQSLKIEAQYLHLKSIHDRIVDSLNTSLFPIIVHFSHLQNKEYFNKTLRDFEVFRQEYNSLLKDIQVYIEEDAQV